MKLLGRAMALLVVAAALLVGLAVIGPMTSPASTGEDAAFDGVGGDAGHGTGADGDMVISGEASGTAFLDAPADAVPMTVTFLVDGDTLSAAPVGGGDELRIRIIGIDTPETHPEVECYGPEAAAELARIAPVGTTLLASEDVEPADRYGRALRYLWDVDGSIGLRLVAGGYAEAIRVGANDAFWPELSAAEQDAKDAGRGMWGAC